MKNLVILSAADSLVREMCQSFMSLLLVWECGGEAMGAKCFGSCPFACSSHIAYSRKADEKGQPTVRIPILILSHGKNHWKKSR